MRFFDHIRTFFRNVATLARPSPDLREAMRAIMSKVGVNINRDNALQVTAVFACIRLISETIASLPLVLYEKTPEGKIKAEGRPDFQLYRDAWNPEVDSFQGMQVFVANLLLYGRGYAEKVYDGAGRLVQMWNITTPNVQIQRNKITKEIEYVVTVPGEGRYLLKREQVFRVDWFSLDGVNAFKPLVLAQNAIGLGIASEEFAASYFKNGANVSGVVEYPEGLEVEKYDEFRKSMREAYTGLSNSARLLFLEQGSKFQKVSNTPEESQMIDTRKFQVIEAARFYNVPPHMIGDLERATFSNIEQMSLNFVIYCLRPYLVRFERAAAAQNLTAEERRTFFHKFNVDALLRGDYKSRMEGFALARQNGWMSANDIRERDDQDLIPEEEGGNAYLANGNLRSLRALMEAAASSTQTGGEQIK